MRERAAPAELVALGGRVGQGPDLGSVAELSLGSLLDGRVLRRRQHEGRRGRVPEERAAASVR